MNRDELADALRAENIETRKYFYPPLHKQKLYRKFDNGSSRLSVTDQVSNDILSLPIGETFDDRTISDTIYAIKRIHEYVAPVRGGV
jgi:dTDP-4-amino-4,6-dideoxygalactose transaminase